MVNYEQVYFKYINIPVVLSFIIPYLSCLIIINLAGCSTAHEDKLIDWIFFFVGLVVAKIAVSKLNLGIMVSVLSIALGIILSPFLKILIEIITGISLY